ncbi:50S ribosomal protein L32 [Candidatus Parcubacteria bacterium]|nr:MAG: 50S ribosomal protein L32 [Candidatus Parcubacteria bacterium]
MGGVPVKHHSKGKVGRRRSHHALQKAPLVPCRSCRTPVLPHRVCAHCGTYQVQRAQTNRSETTSSEQLVAPDQLQSQKHLSSPNQKEGATQSEATNSAEEQPSSQQDSSATDESASSP